MKRTICTVSGVLTISALLSGVSAKPSWLPPGAGKQPGAVIDIPMLGPTGGGATDINEWGLITGVTDTPAGAARGFKTWPVGDLTLVGTLGGAYSLPNGINDLGDVVGESATAKGFGSAFAQFDGRIYDLPFISAADLNNLRVVAGWTNRSALWSLDGTVPLSTPLPPPGDQGGDGVSIASAGVNDRGIAAGYYVSNWKPYAVRWERNGTLTELGPGTPTDINESGDVVAWGYSGPSFVWSEKTGRTDLPGFMWPLGINDAGQVVGICTNDTPSSDPCVWTEDTGAIRLYKPVDGYARATAVNDFGEVVGSLGEWNGTGHSLWWYEPPPIERLFETAQTLLGILRQDHVLLGHRGALLAFEIRAAEGAWTANRHELAEKWLAHAGNQLTGWRHGPEGGRLVHLEALLTRLSLRVAQ